MQFLQITADNRIPRAFEREEVLELGRAVDVGFSKRGENRHGRPGYIHTHAVWARGFKRYCCNQHIVVASIVLVRGRVSVHVEYNVCVAGSVEVRRRAEIGVQPLNPLTLARRVRAL